MATASWVRLLAKCLDGLRLMRQIPNRLAHADKLHPHHRPNQRSHHKAHCPPPSSPQRCRTATNQECLPSKRLPTSPTGAARTHRGTRHQRRRSRPGLGCEWCRASGNADDGESGAGSGGCLGAPSSRPLSHLLRNHQPGEPHRATGLTRFVNGGASLQHG